MSERITDEAWVEVKARCVSGLETMLSLEADRARRVEQELADAAEEMNGAIILLIDGDKRAVDAIAQSAGRLTEALRLAGRLP